MDCTCIDSYYGDDDEWSVEPSETYPSAKKRWKCCECGGVIPVGEKYSCVTGRWDGKFVVHRTCIDCRSVTENLFCGYTFTQVWFDLFYHLSYSEGEIPWEKLSKLTPVAKDKVCDLIEEIWNKETNDEQGNGEV